jgi:hypothetical protein
MRRTAAGLKRGDKKCIKNCFEMHESWWSIGRLKTSGKITLKTVIA